MWKYRIIYLAAFIFAAYMYIWTNGRQSLLLLILLCVFPVISGMLAWIQMRVLGIDIRLPVSCIMGQEAYAEFHLKKGRGIFIGKISLSVTCHNRMFRKDERKQLLTYAGHKKELVFTLPLDTDLCGKCDFILSDVFCYDALGLWRIRKVIDKKQSVLIYPQLYKINLFLKQRPRSGETGDLYDEEVKGNDTSEIFDMRDYREGDGIRFIHWKLSSKIDKLIVREFSRPANYNTIILFDLSRFYGKDKVSDIIISRVAALTVSVSGGLWRLNIGHQIGCMLKDGFIQTSIDGQNSCIRFMNDITSMTVHEQMPNTIEAFMKLELYYQYTKVIFITGKLKEELLKNLSQLVSLSVIIPWEGEKDYMDRSAGYDVLSLSINELENNYLNLYI